LFTYQIKNSCSFYNNVFLEICYYSFSSLKLNRPYNIPKGSPTALSGGITGAWFVVHFLVSFTTELQHTLQRDKGIAVNPAFFINPDWFYIYLTPAQCAYLRSSKLAEFVKYEPPLPAEKAAALSVENKLLIVAHPAWTPSNPSTKFRKISSDVFIVEAGGAAKDLYSDSGIFSVSPAPVAEFANAYTAGYIQNGDSRMGYTNENFGSDRSLQSVINGSGEVITICDSGLDRFHPLFYDDAEIGPNHRKIINYTAYVDDVDNPYGHGTHVAGTAVDDADCTACGIGSFNGMAPKAKIFFFDTVKYGKGYMHTDFNPADLVAQMRLLGSYVHSASWGYQPPSLAYIKVYEEVCYNSPDILMVFSAGNEGDPLTVRSPSDAKNTISVAALAEIPLRGPNRSQNIVRYIKYDSGSAEATVAEGSVDPTTMVVIDKPTLRSSYTAVALADYPSEPTGAEAVLLTGTADIDKALALNPPMIVVRESAPQKVSASIPVLFANVPADISRFTVVFTVPEYPPPRASYSSRGPSFYGVGKPDIAAPGTLIVSASAGDITEQSPRPLSLTQLTVKSGTSMAAPVVGGAAVMVRQYYRTVFVPHITPSGILLRASLLSATTANRTDFDLGAGALNLAALLPTAARALQVADNFSIPRGSHLTAQLECHSSDSELRITLAWLDPPYNFDGRCPILNDVTIVLETPSKALLFAKDTQFRTNARIIVPAADIELGTYTVHLLAADFPIGESVMVAVAAVGPFTQNGTFAFSSTTLCLPGCAGECDNGICRCTAAVAGPCCTDAVPVFCEDETIELTLEPLVPVYYRYNGTVSKERPLKISTGTIPVNCSIHVGVYSGSYAKPITHKGWYINLFTRDTQSSFIYEGSEGDNIFLEFHTLAYAAESITITLSHASNSDTTDRENQSKGTSGVTIGLSIGVPLFVVIVVVVVIYYLRRKARSDRDFTSFKSAIQPDL
jgi:hypothetical protein